VEPVIGFDLEWKPNFTKGHTENPVALIQLASADTIVLLHIAKWSWTGSSNTFTALEVLRGLLHDPRIKKLGVNIKEDGKKLYRDTRGDIYGCIDLSELAHKIDPESWDKNTVGLARLSSAYLRLDLEKKHKVTRSNWELSLNEEQLLYAANDAAVAVAVYFRIMQLINPVSPPDIGDYEFNVIEGAFKQLSLAARETARTFAPPPSQAHAEPEMVVSAYTIFVQE